MLFDGQEDHADAVGTGLGESKSQLLAFAREELVRDLNQHTGAVAGFGITAARAAVGEVQKNLNSFPDDVVTFAAADAGYEPDAARIMFVRRVVEALRRRESGTRVGTRRLGHRQMDTFPFESTFGRKLPRHGAQEIPAQGHTCAVP